MSIKNIPNEVLDHILLLVYWGSRRRDFLNLRLVYWRFDSLVSHIAFQHATQHELARAASKPSSLDRCMGRRTHWRRGVEWMLVTKARVHFLDAQVPFAFLRDAVQYLQQSGVAPELDVDKIIAAASRAILAIHKSSRVVKHLVTWQPGKSLPPPISYLETYACMQGDASSQTSSQNPEAFCGMLHLMLACGSEVASKIDSVINASASPNTTGSISSHPLLRDVMRTAIHLEEVVGLEALLKHVDLDAIVDGKGSNALVYAAETDRKNAVRLLLRFSTGVQINARGSFGLTTLGWAARRGWTDIVQLLLQNDDINADIGNHEGETPLAEAAKKNYDDIAQLLMAKTSVILGSEKSCPLMLAFDHCAFRVLRLFLDRFGDEIDINQEIAGHNTPLTLAAQRGIGEAVQMLLEVPGIEPDLPDLFHKFTPVAWTVWKGSLSAARHFVNLDVDITNGVNGVVPVVLAMERGELGMVDLLIHKTLDTYHPRCTELMFWPNSFQNRILAIQHLGQNAQFRKDHAHEFKRVLEDATGRMIASLAQEVPQHKEVDTSWTLKHDVHDLCHAIRHRSYEKVKLQLARNDLDINMRYSSGSTALMDVVSRADIPSMKALMEYPGIDLNLDSPGQGSLVFHLGMSRAWGDPLLVHEPLISRKRLFSPYLTWDDKAGKNAPLLIAAEKKLSDAFELLYDDPRTNLYITDCVGRTCLWYTVQNSNKRMVEKILDHTPRIWEIINAQDGDGMAPLHVAASVGNFEIARMLISHPIIDINAVDRYGWTALHMALVSGAKRLPRLLLKRPEIDLSLQIEDGLTTFDFLRRYRTDLLA